VIGPVQHGTDDAAAAAVRVGRTVRDKWHLDALIDVGGMAAVYAATHRNGMRGAVKILHKHRSLDVDVGARFRREGYIANRVAHPNVVRVLDDDVDDDGSTFLVMELLEGATLRERAGAHGGKLPPDEVLLAADQLLDVLAVAHEEAIIHRDVKPENVFVTTTGQVKLLDFGIARLFEPGARGHAETVAGLPMGSPAFMSPEQARGRWDLVDVQSDVWSVGATMFTLLCGHDVHVADTVPELLAAIFTKPAASLATAVPGSHPAVVEVVDRALQLRLADRWPDARTMQVAVRRAYLEMYGEPHTRAAVTVSISSQDASRTPARSVQVIATTVAQPETAAVSGRERGFRRLPRALALASAAVLAGALGMAGVSRGEGAQARRMDTSLQVGEAFASFSAAPPSWAPPAPLVAPPRPPSMPSSSAAPVPRAHRKSVYDRRY